MALLIVSGWLAPWPQASADEASDKQEQITGIERPARYPSDAARATGNVLLFLPRITLNGIFEQHIAGHGFASDLVCVG